MADKGVIIEYDFAVLDGAELLYKTAAQYFEKVDEIKMDRGSEARFLVGNNYQTGITDFFTFLNTKKTPQKAAKELPVAFTKALQAAIPGSVPPGFKALVKGLEEKGVKVLITTRAEIEKVSAAFQDILSDNVKLYHETSVTYGNVKWDAWKRAVAANGTPASLSCALTGSGFGVKSALIAGLAAVGVITPHTEWQDYSGADAVVEKLDEKALPRILRSIKVS